ncbi:hypothetical protein MANI_025256 [Metarhizium anisopliae]|nr:hypothetical protein MANI_025256 [Metarhizium anisopliae]
MRYPVHMPTPQAVELSRLLAVHTTPEHAITEFWEHVLRLKVFPVRNIEDDTVLLLLEAKRANATRDQIEAVEYQAFTACCAHLFQTQKQAISGTTCVDIKARVWAYKRNDDYETPFWPPGDELSEIGQDAEYSTRSKELVEALEHVKKNPIPDKAIFENTPSLRPLSATSYGITVNRFENRGLSTHVTVG